MTKKVVDIVPRKEKKEKKEKPVVKKKRKKRSKKKVGSWIIIVVIVVLLVVWFLSPLYSKLTLKVQPRTEVLVIEDIVEVNIKQIELALEDKIIPGRFFDVEEEKEQDFITIGKQVDGVKAEGFINVYNSHDPPRAVNLRETTRFLSSEGGKIFRAPDKIYLPPAELEGSKVVPSVTKVKVVAQEPGEDYNIGPCKFSVPGLAGNPLYYTIWAESDTSMQGGSKKEVKIITEQDLELAATNLKQELLSVAKVSLEQEIPEEYVLREEFFFVSDFQYSCSNKQGDKIGQFTCQGNIQANGLSFKLSDLKEIAMDRIRDEIPEDKDFDIQSLTLEFFSKNLVSETGKMILDLTIKVNVYDKIAEDNIIAQIKAKTKKEIKDIIFDNYPQIDKIEFSFWPFWVVKAPSNIEKIKLELTF